MDSLLKNGAEPNARMGRKRFTSASNNMTKSCEKFALKRAMIAALTGTRERTLSVLSKLKNIAPRAKTMLASKNALKIWWKKTEECRVAFYEKESFECGIDFEVECGKSRKLGPIELVHCIEERHPCDPKNWILLSTSRFSIPLQRSCFIKIRIAVGGECLLWLSVMQQVIGACMPYYSYQNNGRA